MSQTPEWPAEITKVIAGEVKRYLKVRKMSVQGLSDEVGALGMGMTIERPVLSNLINGRRRTISVAEWLVLARALKVPPLLLLYPIGRRTDKIEALPGVKLTPWEAEQYAETGEYFLSPTDSDPTIELFREHEAAVRKWHHAGADLREAQRLPDDERVVDGLRSNVSTLEALLRQLRLRMQSLGLVPPTLPPGLGHLDESSAR